MTSSFHQGVLASSGKPSVFRHHPQRTTEFTTLAILSYLMGHGKGKVVLSLLIKISPLSYSTSNHNPTSSRLLLDHTPFQLNELYRYH